MIQTSQINVPPDFIDLGLGDPQFTLLPLALIRQAAETCFAQNDPAFLQYGSEQGDGYFRVALAAFLSKGYSFTVDADKLLVTSGASGGLDLICTLFTRPGDTILVEEPSYFLALRIFKDHDLQVVPVQTDRNGLVIEDLKQKLDRNITKLSSIYQSRLAVMDTALRQYLPDCIYTTPQGGYFFWVRLPDAINALDLQEKAKSFKVGFRPGVRFSSGGGLQDYIRLSYAFYEPEQIQEGLRRLQKCLDI